MVFLVFSCYSLYGYLLVSNKSKLVYGCIMLVILVPVNRPIKQSILFYHRSFDQNFRSWLGKGKQKCDGVIRLNEILTLSLLITVSQNRIQIYSNKKIKCPHIFISTQEDHSIIKIEEEEFEDTKGVIRIRIPQQNRQHNCQKKKYKKTNNDHQNLHIKLKIE